MWLGFGSIVSHSTREVQATLAWAAKVEVVYLFFPQYEMNLDSVKGHWAVLVRLLQWTDGVHDQQTVLDIDKRFCPQTFVLHIVVADVSHGNVPDAE